MKWQLLITDIFDRIAEQLEEVLNGLTPEELNRQPAPGANTIGWLTWHLTRSHDRNISELAGKEYLWISDSWHARFNLPPNPSETGYGHSSDNMAAFMAPDSATILKYHRAVLEVVKSYLDDTLTEEELDRDSQSPTLGTVSKVERRLLGVINDGLQHIGQAAYVRGLIKGQGWLGR